MPMDFGYAIRVADQKTGSDSAVKERAETKQKEPQLYKVLLLNDDYSTMDFVIEILETVFLKSPAEAYRIMMQVHLNGSGLAGVYPWDIAETKVDTVSSLARSAGFPLRAAIEEA
jgi:ATP-dependent Clp protease adaptor protein ClpS